MWVKIVLIFGPRENKKKEKKWHFQCKMLYHIIKWKCERPIFVYLPFSIHDVVIAVLDGTEVVGMGENPVMVIGY